MKGFDRSTLFPVFALGLSINGIRRGLLNATARVLKDQILGVAVPWALKSFFKSRKDMKNLPRKLQSVLMVKLDTG